MLKRYLEAGMPDRGLMVAWDTRFCKCIVPALPPAQRVEIQPAERRGMEVWVPIRVVPAVGSEFAGRDIAGTFRLVWELGWKVDWGRSRLREAGSGHAVSPRALYDPRNTPVVIGK